MSYPPKTPAAARRLGVTYHRLMGLIRFGKIPAPQKDESGDYLWLPEDIERARVALGIKELVHA
jgi:DNA-binding transcriptional MerR regulator